MIEMLSASIAVAAAVIATVQAIVARRAAHGELMGSMLTEFWREENLGAREIVFTLDAKPATDWTASEVEAAESVARQLSHIGILVKNRYVAERAFMTYWAEKALRAYVVLEPHINARRLEWNSPDQWLYAEWLGRRAALFLKNRRQLRSTRGWSRLLARTGELADPRGSKQ